MKIYLMRHGIAREPGSPSFEDDSQRPLTANGCDKINQIAGALKKLDIKPDLILSSPFVRAEQTAAILAKKFDRRKNLKFSDLLIPNGKAEAIITEIVGKYMLDELLIVGHEPCLTLLMCALVAVDLDRAIHIKKGGVCCLSARELRIDRRATIEWLLTPKILLKV